MDILQCIEYGPEDFCPTGWYRHVFCRRGMDRADLTVSETSPQGRRTSKSRARGNCTAPGECSCADGWGGHDCSEPQCEGGCAGHGACVAPGQCKCFDGWNGTSCTVPEAHTHPFDLVCGTLVPRPRLAGAARSARRLSLRPTARATAGARAPERVGWEVAACEQPHLPSGLRTRHVHSTRRARQLRVLRGLARRTLRRAVTAYRAVKRMECARSEDVFARARTCVLVSCVSSIMTCITIYHVVS
jgi:hypothetical protein